MTVYVTQQLAKSVTSDAYMWVFIHLGETYLVPKTTVDCNKGYSIVLNGQLQMTKSLVCQGDHSTLVS